MERFEHSPEAAASPAETSSPVETSSPAPDAGPPAPTPLAPPSQPPVRRAAAAAADALGRLALEPVEARFRDAIAWGVLVVAAGLGTIAAIAGRVDRGFELSTVETGPGGGPAVVVASVAPWSEAARQGLGPGMIVIELNGQPLLSIPGLTDESGTPEAGLPPHPMPLDREVWNLEVTWPWMIDDLLAGRGGYVLGLSIWEATYRLQSSWIVFVLALALAVGVWWWLATGRAGDRLRRLAWPAAAAVAGPLALYPLQATASGPGYILTAVLLAAVVLPLADGLSALVDDPERRRAARIASGVVAVVAVVCGLAVVSGVGGWAPVGQWLAAGLVVALPGVAAARAAAQGRLADGAPPSGRIVEAIEAPALGLTPVFAALPLAVPGSGPFLAPLLIWLAGLLAAQRFTVRPLARLATRTALQRDLIVAATEAERARIAADIHDDVLQELTMLVRHLDASGASDAATTARRVAERLRAITGELRLPILDDLGVGPALEWLVARVERLSGGEVRLERDDGARLPPEVELAFFRVAQEALANAVKHGRPPIVVRYRTSPTGATLTVDDSGPGIAPGAAEAARLGGHFGLLGMEQRAEQIGAILDVRRWPGGGTHVALEWRAR